MVGAHGADVCDPWPTRSPRRQRAGTADTRLKTRSPGYVLELAPRDVDAHRFRQLVEDARAVLPHDPAQARRLLAAALALWRGPALGDFEYAEFAAAEIRGLEEERLAAIELLHTAELALEHHLEVIPKLSSLVTEHPYREQLHALLITALYRSGRQADALRAYQDLRRRLRDDLGIDPSPELVALETEVLLQSGSLQPSARARRHDAPDRGDVGRRAPIPNHNLPAHLTRFVGRVNELAVVVELIEANRLVTVVGAGGAGKTRLAVEVASSLVTALVDRVVFVDLATVIDSELVDQAVFAAAGATELPHRSVRESLVEHLVDHLVDHNLLIVLDNCEHVTRAAASIAGYILSQATGLRILATSQHVLKVSGETVYPIPPMATSSTPGAGGELSSEAARLFVDHAQRARPGFVPTADDAAHIGAIVRQLDGIPLAIELAAARTRMMMVSDIASHLTSRLSILTGGSSTVRRQETLEATVAWSYDLTQGRERDLFSSLSIFAGAFAHDAAAAVGGIDDPIEAFELMGRLVDKSLVFVDATGDEIRYRLLETLRIFGAARLAERGEDQPVAARHARHHLTLVRGGDDLLGGPDQGIWQRRFRSSAPDLRTALDWLITRRPDEALVAAAGLGRYWYREGSFVEGTVFLERALGAANETSSSERAHALRWLAGFKYLSGLVDESRRIGIEAVALAREVGDHVALSGSLNLLGMAAESDGELRDALAYYEEAVDAEERSSGHKPAAVLWNIGVVCVDLADIGGVEKIVQVLRDASQSGGAVVGLANADLLQSHVAIVSGDLQSARELAARALAVFSRLGSEPDIAQANERLAEISGLEGDLAGVDRHLTVASELEADLDPKHHWRANLVRSRRALATGDIASATASLGHVLLAAVDCEHPFLLSSFLHETSRLAFIEGRCHRCRVAHRHGRADCRATGSDARRVRSRRGSRAACVPGRSAWC